jgi:drug/metabolite transporter (DMT)-like permease
VIYYKDERVPLTTDRAMRVAPLLFVLLWSSSFITTKIGLRHISPLLFVAIRLVACGFLLTVLMLLLRASWRPLSGWKWLHCAIAGALMNVVGLMAPHVGLLTAPAAQVALVQSLTPLLAAAFGVVVLREGLRASQWLGLVLGLVGVGLVVGEAALESTIRFQGLVLPFVGVLGLVAGTLYLGASVALCPRWLGLPRSFYLRPSSLRFAHGRWKRPMLNGRIALSWLWHGTPSWFLLGYGALLRHARSWHSRPCQREFLSRPRHRSGARGAIPR